MDKLLELPSFPSQYLHSIKMGRLIKNTFHVVNYRTSISYKFTSRELSARLLSGKDSIKNVSMKSRECGGRPRGYNHTVIIHSSLSIS